MEDELHHRVPKRDIKKAQANNGKAHDAARGEGDAQTAVESLLRGGSRAAVGARGNGHADEAGKAGEKAAGHKGEGHEPGDKPGRRHAAEHDEHACKKDRDRAILPLEECRSARADGAGYLLHQRRPLREGKDLFALQPCKYQRDHAGSKADAIQIFHHCLLLLSLNLREEKHLLESLSSFCIIHAKNATHKIDKSIVAIIFYI